MDAAISPPTTDDSAVLVPLKPHSYPIWLVGVAALVVAAAAYSATLAPPYLSAQFSMWRGEAALNKGDRAAAEAHYLEVLQAFPASKPARIEIAIALLGDSAEAQQQRGLAYLEGVELDKYEWRRVGAVLPARFRDQFHTVTK
jgi:hypothetical protein